MNRHCCGIEIGGTKLQIVLGDNAGKIAQRHRFAVNPIQGSAGIRRHIESTLSELGRTVQIEAVGVGFGGPVDWKTGKVCCSHQIEGWFGFDLGEWLHSLTNQPIVVDNDANVAALGEALCGAGVGFDPVFYITLGSGVGGGLVAQGKIYHGAKPGESEIGHVRLDREGTILESRCSGWAVDSKIRQLKSIAPESLLSRRIGNSIGEEAKHLNSALSEGDPVARRVIEETAEDLAFGLSHVIHLFHPELIVLGGGLSLVGEPLRSAVDQALRKHVMEAFAPGPSIRLTALGEDAVPVGTLLLAKCTEQSK